MRWPLPDDTLELVEQHLAATLIRLVSQLGEPFRGQKCSVRPFGCREHAVYLYSPGEQRTLRDKVATHAPTHGACVASIAHPGSSNP